MRGGFSHVTQDQLAVLFEGSSRYKFERGYDTGRYERVCSLTDYQYKGINVFFGSDITASAVRKLLKMPLDKLPKYLDGGRGLTAIASRRLELGV